MKSVAAVVLSLLAMMSAGVAIDTSALKPPKGAKVALIVFEDLQCPDCARAEPLLEEAVRTYNIPLVRHDFPLPMHNWSFEAHVIGRYFAEKSPQLAEEYWRFIYANQASIYRLNLRSKVDEFAAQHHTAVPAIYDPKGELAAKVKEDFALGQRAGVGHTPTIYVVSDTQRGTPFIEVVKREELFQLIDQVKAQVAQEQPASEPAAKKKSAAKKQ
ncbi:MAG TPA: thioredoxin domain-containing protein [candidate division Zixibacteria bacterium]|nr:thioredoxin domain-containing protein [candidate division Zixibacteria bacterium]